MAEKKIITRKVISKTITSKRVVKEVESNIDLKVVEEKRPIRTSEVEVESEKNVRTKRVCTFCQNKSEPLYTDLVALKRFLTERAKIVPKLRSGVCSRHQRGVSKNIKYARHLSLLPFVPKI